MTNHTKTTRKGGRRIRLSPFAKKAVQRLRSLPPSKTAFTLKISEEGVARTYDVLRRGGPASTYFICLTHSGKMPEWLPPDSTYLAKTSREVDTLLAYFADSPELWCAPKNEPLEGNWESYSEDSTSYSD